MTLKVRRLHFRYLAWQRRDDQSIQTYSLSKSTILKSSSRISLMASLVAAFSSGMFLLLTRVQFKYFHSENDLWSADYVRNLDPQVIPYDDTNEDKDVKLDEILKYEHKDELALADWAYDGHSIDDTPNYGDVESPLKDMYALHFYLPASVLIILSVSFQLRALAWLLL